VGVTFEEEGTCTEHFQILCAVEFKLICRSTDLKEHQYSARPVGKDGGRQGSEIRVNNNNKRSWFGNGRRCRKSVHI